MGQYRMLKLGEQIREEISELIMKQKVKDPRVSTFLSINRVEVARDLAYATVYVSSFLNESQIKKGVEGLNSAAGFIQSSIAKKLTIRQFPKLTFVADSSIKDGFDMVNKLNRLEAEENALRTEEAGAETNGEPSEGFKRLK